MKTTIEIADDLAESARAYAASQRMTFRSLIERALRELLRTERRTGQFTLRDASVQGRGLHPDFSDAEWSRIRAAVYEDRGG